MVSSVSHLCRSPIRISQGQDQPMFLIWLFCLFCSSGTSSNRSLVTRTESRSCATRPKQSKSTNEKVFAWVEQSQAVLNEQGGESKNTHFGSQLKGLSLKIAKVSWKKSTMIPIIAMNTMTLNHYEHYELEGKSWFSVGIWTKHFRLEGAGKTIMLCGSEMVRKISYNSLILLWNK